MRRIALGVATVMLLAGIPATARAATIWS